MFLFPLSCVHRDRRPDQTVSGAPSPHFVFFVFESLLFCSCLSVLRLTQAHRSREVDPAVRGESQPAIRGSLNSAVRRGKPTCHQRLPQARRHPWLSQVRRPQGSQPAVPPLTHLALFFVFEILLFGSCLFSCGSPKPTVRGRSRPLSAVRRSSKPTVCGSSNPQLPSLAQEGFLFLWAVLIALSSSVRFPDPVLILSCVFSPRGLLIPPRCPMEFFWGVVESWLWWPGQGDRGQGHEDHPPWLFRSGGPVSCPWVS